MSARTGAAPKTPQKLQRELAHEHRKVDPRARAESRKAWIAQLKAGKARMKAKREPD